MQLNIPGVKNFEKGVVVKYSNYCFANGSCADIWKAKLGGQTVAVKVWRGVPYTEALKRTFHQLLSKELGTWGELKHPNIVAFFGLVEEYGHLPGLVLPFYENGTAIEYLRRFEEAPVFPLVKDVASALSYMQSFDPPVTHGELKASNILIADDGKALLCDFGLGSINGEMNFTSANICGTCRWTAPEIMTPPEDVPFVPATPASDVYSFAMTMIEMFTRKPPFSHIRNDAAVIFEAVEGRRPRRPLPHVSPQLTDGVWKVMEHCWTHEAIDRPTAYAVFHWLETLEKLNLHLPAPLALPEQVQNMPEASI